MVEYFVTEGKLVIRDNEPLVVVDGVAKALSQPEFILWTSRHRNILNKGSLGEMNLKGDGSKKEDVDLLSWYVEIIKETAKNYSLPVCDLYANSGLQPNIPLIKEYYLPDGLHPNDKGHERIADRLGAFLKSL